MKYLKYLEDDTVIGVDAFGEQYFIGKIEGQPKQGPTIICFKNPNTGVTRTVYTGKNIYKEDESPIQYTWRYEESYNGHPAIIVNFSRIDSGYADNIICLESNNMAKGGTYMPANKYNIKDKNNNRALNVLTTNRFISGELNLETEGITWYRLGDLRLNTDYPIYITVTPRYKSFVPRNIDGSAINNWEVRINVRPTIRGTLYLNINNFNQTTFRHTPSIPAKDYISVKFPYINIFQI